MEIDLIPAVTRGGGLRKMLTSPYVIFKPGKRERSSPCAEKSPPLTASCRLIIITPGDGRQIFRGRCPVCRISGFPRFYTFQTAFPSFPRESNIHFYPGKLNFLPATENTSSPGTLPLRALLQLNPILYLEVCENKSAENKTMLQRGRERLLMPSRERKTWHRH